MVSVTCLVLCCVHCSNLGELSSSFELTTNACDKAPESVRYLEHVQAVVTVHYSRRGDLQLHLVSPSGTRSTILPRRKNDDDERQGFIDWPFLSVFCWGEDPRGTWTLIVENTGSPSNKGAFLGNEFLFACCNWPSQVFGIH